MAAPKGTLSVLGHDVTGVFRMKTNTGIKRILGWGLLVVVLAFCANVISGEAGRPLYPEAVLGLIVLGFFALFFLAVSVALIRAKPGILFNGFRVSGSAIESGMFKVALGDMVPTYGMIQKGMIQKGEWQTTETFSNDQLQVTITVKQTGMRDADFQFYGVGVILGNGRTASLQVPEDPSGFINNDIVLISNGQCISFGGQPTFKFSDLPHWLRSFASLFPDGINRPQLDVNVVAKTVAKVSLMYGLIGWGVTAMINERRRHTLEESLAGGFGLGREHAQAFLTYAFDAGWRVRINGESVS
jgi:hypothetical protein